MDTERERLADVIRVLARAQNITMTELARKAGMSRTSLYARLDGITHFTFEDLHKLAAALNVGAADLLCEREEVGRILTDLPIWRLQGYAITAVPA